MNPEFIERRKSKEQIIQEYINNFEGARGNGAITHDEFFEYYTDLSMSIPNDEQFVKILESTFQCPEEDMDSTAHAAIQMLVKEVRLRVLQLAHDDPELVRKVFQDFDLRQSGALTIDEFTNMIAKIKIAVERKYIHPFFKSIDRNNSGMITLQDFETYVLSKQ